MTDRVPRSDKVRVIRISEMSDEERAEFLRLLLATEYGKTSDDPAPSDHVDDSAMPRFDPTT